MLKTYRRIDYLLLGRRSIKLKPDLITLTNVQIVIPYVFLEISEITMFFGNITIKNNVHNLPVTSILNGKT